jgi:hypothetical protein
VLPQGGRAKSTNSAQLLRDGNAACALIGKNFVEGVAGFGANRT